MYQALYRKHRPLSFRDVIGQSHITDTLRRQVQTGRVNHAYLFTGSRGTGKTTCARILARAVNCEHPTDGNPCNECAACLSILADSATDVLEMDAASHSGVDNIRALREELNYTPVHVRKRVYIIDEVHMLSTGAFNALLKSMEEPPEHVVFILATTETHKVPATIVSRCQRFAFRRLQPPDIAAQLSAIAGAEGIDLTAEAAGLLARMADGAMRDGISLLDQCAACAEGFSVDLPLVHETLGLAGTWELAEWIRVIAARDAPGALTRLDEFYQDGKELSALLDGVSQLLRDLLMAHMLGNAQSSSRLESDTVKELAGMLSARRLIAMLAQIQDTQQKLPRSVSRRIETELCVMRLCGLAAAEPTGDESRSSAPRTPPANVSQPPAPAVPAPPSTPAAPPPEPHPASADVPPTPEPTPAAQSPEQVPQKAAPVAGNSAEIVAALRADCSPLYRVFLDGAEAAVTETGLRLLVKTDFYANTLKTPDFTDFVESKYPGATVIAVKPPSDEGGDRLGKLAETAGGLISFDDDDDDE